MDELISRKKAIDLLDNLIGMVDDNNDSDYDAALKMGIEALKAEEPNLQPTCNQLATDTISRQDAIDALKIAELGCEVEAIEALPSAEPVRKGTWVLHWEHCEREKVLASGLTSYFWCSVCNMPSPAVTNFCPNCGAFMSEGETDD